MASLIEEVSFVLERQLEVYNELIYLGEEKRQLVVDNDLDSLQKLLLSEQELVGKNAKIDRERDQLFKDMAFVINESPDSINLKTICEHTKGQPICEKLTHLRENILVASQKLKDINDNNKKLIELALEHVDFSINLIRDNSGPVPNFYDSSGNEIVTHQKNFFDARQ